MMGSKKTSTLFKRKLLTLAVVSCFGSQMALAAPTGGSVASGSASIATAGSTMTVTNTPNAIINWASFGIAAGETVKFVQQSAASAVLNRVTGTNPSSILGALQSNGKVFLINPNGIMFGAGAQINVNGLVASTLNLSDADFLAGRMNFNADRATPGSVVNAGNIETPTGGYVYLLAPNIENSGVITTPGGEAILAAGNSVEIVNSTDPSQRVLVSATSHDLNLSQLMTQSNGNIFSVLNSGKVSANTAVQDATGKIYFKSAGNIQTTSTSVVEAKGDINANGGSFIGFADNNGVYAGAFNVSGKNGGFVETSGHWIDVNSASINMTGLNGNGGEWLLDPTNVCIFSSACAGSYDSVISAATILTGLSSGDVTIQADNDIFIQESISYSSGNYRTLKLRAGHDIFNYPFGIGVSIVEGVIELVAGHDINIGYGGVTSLTAQDIKLDAGNNIVIGGGSIPTFGILATTSSGFDASIKMKANGNITISHPLAATGNASSFIDIQALGDVLVNNPISAYGYGFNEVAIDAANITVTGPVQANAYGTGASAGSSYVGLWSDGTTLINGVLTSTSTEGNAGLEISATSLVTINVAPTVNAYLEAWIDVYGLNAIALNSNLSPIGGSQTGGWASVWIDADSISAGNVNISPVGNWAGVEMFGGSQLVLNSTTISPSSLTSVSLYGDLSGVRLISQNLSITSSSYISGYYVGLNYDPAFIQTNAADFFNWNATSTTTVDSSSIFGDLGVGFAGYDVTFNNGASVDSFDQMHGIAMNDLKLNQNSSLFAANEMLLEVGGHLYLDLNSYIDVGSIQTLYFNFPLLASDGWYVDGVANAFNGSTGSYIRVAGTTPIIGSGFFVTYGGLNLIDDLLGLIDGGLEDPGSSVFVDDSIVADGPTADDFFGTGEDNTDTEEEQQKEEDKPQQCSA